tara:strand:+ start:1693 stop:2034 length:342 start_codon:yes stop_codon:yes gene_type:complete
MTLESTKAAANELLMEKYEPILVIKLRRVPPMEELHAFANKIQEDFKYQTLVLPGELETTVDIVSVCKSEIVEIEELKKEIFKSISKLDEEIEEVENSKTLKKAKDILNGKKN